MANESSDVVLDTAILEGAVSIEACLRGRSREVFSILAGDVKNERSLSRMWETALEYGLYVEQVEPSVVDQLASGRSHGGIVAKVGPRRYVQLRDLVGERYTFLVMLDGVEDPYNFGAALRSLYAAGADGLIVRPRNWLSAAAVVARSSAGASELLPTAVAEGPEVVAELCAASGYGVFALDQFGQLSLDEVNLGAPLLLIIGGEQRGLARSFRHQGWTTICIPYGREGAPSLGTAAAAAVAGFEVARQRRPGRS